MLDLKGKLAVITGGSSGIGLGIARALAKEGATLVLVGMTPKKIEAAVQNIQALGAPAMGIQCDVTQRNQVEALAQHIYSIHDNVDILVNNAGVGSGGSVDQLTDSDWDWVMSVNMRAVFLCCSVFVPRMLEAGKPAHIVNMGSEQSFGLADPDFGSMTVYAASKHALLGLSEAMRRDYAGKG
ncbi:MAG: SDR family NAD(P)-dependent oxidoreductase, partial [Proteobacteria bacterium]|nr:SDR family NAD(P)-dependent oxidoreductase [Pseudomonadota bacterium]